VLRQVKSALSSPSRSPTPAICHARYRPDASVDHDLAVVPFHQPFRHVTGLRVAPDQVCVAVSIQVARRGSQGQRGVGLSQACAIQEHQQKKKQGNAAEYTRRCRSSPADSGVSIAFQAMEFGSHDSPRKHAAFIGVRGNSGENPPGHQRLRSKKINFRRGGISQGLSRYQMKGQY
jgi:hypothetical protein